MDIREEKELYEEQHLSKYAALSSRSKGREKEIEPCDLRTCYQRDRDRIIHCKAFRRLKHKTQVFLAPSGDHYRTRLTHTLEVSQIARSIASSLRLNEDLTEAIALGHDLGHTPFGHAGERALNKCIEFSHTIQSLRVVDFLENDGEGLNLTYEVRDGILNHTEGEAVTIEGRIVKLADKIAYVNHDMDDAMRAGILYEEDIPAEVRKTLGETRKDRLDKIIHDIVANSYDRDDVRMSDEIYGAYNELRQFLFDNLYFNPVCKSEEAKAEAMVITLYNHYVGHLEEIPEEYRKVMDMRGISPERIVADYISGMTDYYSVEVFRKLYIPEFWEK